MAPAPILSIASTSKGLSVCALLPNGLPPQPRRVLLEHADGLGWSLVVETENADIALVAQVTPAISALLRGAGFVDCLVTTPARKQRGRVPVALAKRTPD